MITSKTHLLATRSCMSIACRDVVASHAFPDAISARVQENRSLFAAVRRWGSQAASLWGEAPFLYVCFDKDEAHLSKVDMYLARTLSANRRKEVLRLETMCNIIELLAVASEKNCPSSRPVADSDNVALDISWSVSGGCKRLVVASVAVGSV